MMQFGGLKLTCEMKIITEYRQITVLQEVMKSLVFLVTLKRSKCPSLLMSSEQDLKQLCFSYQSFICFSIENTPLLRC